MVEHPKGTHDVQVEADDEHPGDWKVTTDGRLRSRHPTRKNAIDHGMAEARRDEAPTDLEINADADPAEEPEPHDPEPPE